MYSVGIAYLLWFLSGFGFFGFHRFYLGKIGTGLLWMLTGGGFLIGTIYDFFTLPGQVREANIRRALDENLRANTRRDWANPSSRAGTDPGNNGGWRYVNDGEARVVHPAKEKESPERAILRLAKENRGVLTVSETALAADISVDEAKKCLDALVSKGIAELRVRKSGTLVYVIPDIADKDEPFEDI